MDDATPIDAATMERRGRWWLAVSFLFCPCHLPLTFGLLLAVFGGTAVGALLRDHGWTAGLIIAATWLAGTARGLIWVRRAERGELTCPIPRKESHLGREEPDGVSRQDGSHEPVRPDAVG